MPPDIYLETDRLILRRLTEDDVDNLHELDSDPEVMRYLTGGVPHTRAFILEKAIPHYLSYYDRYADLGFWAAIEKATGRFVGWFHFRPFKENPADTELGYRLRRDAWGRGYATEGSRALIDKGFRELGCTKIVAATMMVNAPSRRVMEKLGMTLEKTFALPGEPFPGWSKEECLEVKYALSKSGWEIAQADAEPAG